MRTLSILFFVLFSLCSEAAIPDSVFSELDKHLDKRVGYELVKQTAIEKLQNSVPEALEDNNLVLLYFLYSELTEEYDSYNYDSALIYGQKRTEIAYLLDDDAKVAWSKSEAANTFIKRGLYREGIDTLLSVDARKLSIDTRVKHYGNIVRAYYDIADYNKDMFFSPGYRLTAEQYVDSVLNTSTEVNYYTLWFEGLRYLARYDLNKAVVIYEEALLLPKITKEQEAQLHSALGYIYREYNQPDKFLNHTIKAASLDLITSTKESMALTSLAGYLFIEGDIDRAHKYVLYAKEDADFFGAKLRQLSLSFLLPKIEAAKLDLIEQRRKQMLQSFLVIGSIMLIILILASISFYQLKKLRSARKIILQSNNELKELTEKLREANKIKTEYIGYYFNFSTQYIDKLEGVKKLIKGFIATKNIDGIERTLKGLDTKEERKRLFQNFDHYFLIIFPEFVSKVNQLLRGDAQITVNDRELNTDLRIFALMRLGIKDNEVIAKILGFSVNTIYTYKTKIKKQALVSVAEFDKKIMEIRSV